MPVVEVTVPSAPVMVCAPDLVEPHTLPVQVPSGLMAKFVDRVGVMYGGKLVEVGRVRDIFKSPMHPYTQLLISSLSSLDVKGALRGIPGAPPSLLNPPSGCVFHPRCPQVMPRCSVEVPAPLEVRPNRSVACHLYD